MNTRCWRLISIFIILTLVSAVGPRSAAAKLIKKTLISGGLERTYHVFLPKGYSSGNPIPLVIALHGGGGRGINMDRGTGGQITREADRRGWIAVFPEGVSRGWNDGRPLKTRRDRERATVNDTAYIADLLAELQKDYSIDAKRIFATGISNGGFMSIRLAIDLSDKFAAIAAVTASLGKQDEQSVPKAPISVMFINGTEDPLVPYNGGQVVAFGQTRGEILATSAAIRWWAARNGCTDQPVSQDLPDSEPGDGTYVQMETFSGGEQGSEVVLVRINGGGHTWPGGVQYLPERRIGKVCRDIDGTELIFDFFARHQRQTTAERPE